MYANSRSNEWSADTQFSASSDEADVITLRSPAESCRVVIFSLTVLVGCCSWQMVSCANLPCNSSQECLQFCLACNSPTPCRIEVPVALRRSPCLKHKRKRIRLLLPLVDSSERSHLPGTSGLKNANQCSPPFVKCTCMLTSGKPPVTTIRRRRLAKTISCANEATLYTYRRVSHALVTLGDT